MLLFNRLRSQFFQGIILYMYIYIDIIGIVKCLYTCIPIIIICYLIIKIIIIVVIFI